MQGENVVCNRLDELKQRAQHAAFLADHGIEPEQLEQELQTIILLASEALAQKSCVRHAQWLLRITSQELDQLEGP